MQSRIKNGLRAAAIAMVTSVTPVHAADVTSNQGAVELLDDSGITDFQRLICARAAGLDPERLSSGQTQEVAPSVVAQVKETFRVCAAVSALANLEEEMRRDVK